MIGRYSNISRERDRKYKVRIRIYAEATFSEKLVVHGHSWS